MTCESIRVETSGLKSGNGTQRDGLCDRGRCGLNILFGFRGFDALEREWDETAGLDLRTCQGPRPHKGLTSRP